MMAHDESWGISKLNVARNGRSARICQFKWRHFEHIQARKLIVRVECKFLFEFGKKKRRRWMSHLFDSSRTKEKCLQVHFLFMTKHYSETALLLQIRILSLKTKLNGLLTAPFGNSSNYSEWGKSFQKDFILSTPTSRYFNWLLRQRKMFLGFSL